MALPGRNWPGRGANENHELAFRLAGLLPHAVAHPRLDAQRWRRDLFLAGLCLAKPEPRVLYPLPIGSPFSPIQ